MKSNRYPGVRPFEIYEANLFFGRETDAQALAVMLQLEKLVVLFGPSGYGKSSLLNAGLSPLLNTETFFKKLISIPIRFKDYNSENKLNIQSTFLQCLQSLPLAAESSYLDRLVPQASREESIWYQFKRRQQINAERFILVFDQFEEFFSYPEVSQINFSKQLNELLYIDIPQVLRDRFDELDSNEFEHLASPFEVKALFAIRSDRLHLLDSMKREFPAILNKRYELQALNRDQAKEAIVRPAALINDKQFVTPAFDYSPSALEVILDQLDQANQNGKRGIEAFQLQVLCEYIESQSITGALSGWSSNGRPEVLVDDLPDFNSVYELYYERRLSELPQDKQFAARLILENGLLYLNSVDDEARRLSVDGRLLIRQYTPEDLDGDLLVLLEKTYLIRREVNSLGGYNYEISHDTLIEPILKARRLREEAEERLKQDRLLTEARLQAIEERRKKRRAIAFSIGAGTLAIISFLSMLYAVRQNRVIQKNYSLFLFSEARKAFDNKDFRSSWLLGRNAQSRYKQKQINTFIDTLKYFVPDSTSTIRFEVKQDNHWTSWIIGERLSVCFNESKRNVRDFVPISKYEFLDGYSEYNEDDQLAATLKNDSAVFINLTKRLIYPVFYVGSERRPLLDRKRSQKIVFCNYEYQYELNKGLSIFDVQRQQVVFRDDSAQFIQLIKNDSVLVFKKRGCITTLELSSGRILSSICGAQELSLLVDPKNYILGRSWYSNTGQLAANNKQGKSYIWALNQGDLRIYNPYTGSLLAKLPYKTSLGDNNNQYVINNLLFIEKNNSRVEVYDLSARGKKVIDHIASWIDVRETSPLGKYLVLTSGDRKIRLFEFKTSKMLNFLKNARAALKRDKDLSGESRSEIYFVDNDKKILFLDKDRQFQLWDIQKKKLIKIFGPTNGFSYYPSTEILTFSNDEGEFQVWDVSTQALKYKLKNYSEWHQIGVDESGQLIHGTTEDKSYFIGSLKTGKELARINYSKVGNYNLIKIGTDLLATKGWLLLENETLSTYLLYDVNQKRILFSGEFHKTPSYYFFYSKALKTLNIIDRKTGAIKRNYKNIEHVFYSNKTPFEIALQTGGIVSVLSLTSLQSIYSFKSFFNSPENVKYIQYSNCIIGIDDNTLKLYDINKKRVVKEFNNVDNFWLSSDRSFLAISFQNSLGIWDLKQNAYLRTIRTVNRILDVFFNVQNTGVYVSENKTFGVDEKNYYFSLVPKDNKLPSYLDKSLPRFTTEELKKYGLE